MRKTIVTAVAAFLLGSATTGALIARAQQAPPMQPPMAGVPPMDRAMGPMAIRLSPLVAKP